MITANTKELVTNSIKEELRGQLGFGWQGKFDGAQYLGRANHRPELALQWVNESIASQKNFQNLSLKGSILLKQEKLNDALPILNEASDLADLNQLNGLGYLLMGNNQLDMAIEFFRIECEA